MLDEDEERDLAHYERKLALKRLADARNGTREREVTPMNIADLESLHNHMDPAGRADETRCGHCRQGSTTRAPRVSRVDKAG
jgi:hypothetical protein